MAGTTHNSPKSGHGPKVRHKRYAWPDRSAYSHSKSDAAFLKQWGSRPESKRCQVRTVAA